MIRNCLVCGKKMNISLDKKGHYDNGHYFGKFRVPIKGKGKYRKIGTSEILGNKTDVVKWTGEKKEIEYWECNKCYKNE